MESTGEEADQLPEQQESGGAGGEDTSENAREETEKNAGVPQEGGQATGNPANAG